MFGKYGSLVGKNVYRMFKTFEFVINCNKIREYAVTLSVYLPYYYSS